MRRVEPGRLLCTREDGHECVTEEDARKDERAERVARQRGAGRLRARDGGKLCASRACIRYRRAGEREDLAASTSISLRESSSAWILGDLAKCASRVLDDALDASRITQGEKPNWLLCAAAGGLSCHSHSLASLCQPPALSSLVSTQMLRSVQHVGARAESTCARRARRAWPGRDGQPEAITIDAVWLRRQHGDQWLVKQ